MKKITVSKFLAVLLSIFLLWNFIWLANYLTYYKFTKGYEKKQNIFNKFDNDFVFTVKFPEYLSFTGNLAVSNVDISIIIWPGYFSKGKYEYGIILQNEDNSGAYSYYVDENLVYDEFRNTDTRNDELIEKNKKGIEALLLLIRKEWNISE